MDRERPWVESLANATGARLKIQGGDSGELPQIRLSQHTDWEGYLAVAALTCDSRCADCGAGRPGRTHCGSAAAKTPQ